MKFRTLAVCTLILALGLPVLAADTPSVKPGKWQMSMQMEMPNMPFKIPPVKMTHCVTAEDMKTAVPADSKNKDCKMSDPQVDGNTVRWTVECPKQKMKGDGEITYTGESMTGAMKMVTDGQETNVKYTGKWLGNCDK